MTRVLRLAAAVLAALLAMTAATAQEVVVGKTILSDDFDRFAEAADDLGVLPQGGRAWQERVPRCTSEMKRERYDLSVSLRPGLQPRVATRSLAITSLQRRFRFQECDRSWDFSNRQLIMVYACALRRVGARPAAPGTPETESHALLASRAKS